MSSQGSAKWQKLLKCGLLCAVTGLAVGCQAVTTPIDGVPASRLPPQFFAPPKNNLEPIDISLLTQEPPRNYLVDAGDILGVYVEGVFPFNPPGATPELPPVHFPEQDSTLPPSLGFPIAIQEDGTLALPLIEPIPVRGLTMDQVRDAIRRAYVDAEILLEEKATPIVSLIKERTYNVVVVRQDGVQVGRQNQNRNLASTLGDFIRGSDQSASGGIVKLPAYQNDILHALMETGGLPGVNAKNEVKVLRARLADKRKRADFLRQFHAQHLAAGKCNPCICPPPIPDDPTILRIPLRLPPGVVPSVRPEDIILEDGDIVYIESRETEVFYTGGMLPGGEHPIPRDYDLDVLGAMAIAGGAVGGIPGQNGMSLGVNVGQVPPGRLYILRKTPCDGQVAIEVDLAKAINDPRQRPLIQAGDTLILQYKPEEELLNFGLGTFFTYGIQELLRSN